MRDFAYVQIKLGFYNQALNKYEFSLTQHQYYLSKTHIEVFIDHKYIGLCNYHLNQYEDALKHYQACYDIADKIFIVTQDEDLNELVDKDSVFKSLDAEKEQYSFINY